MLNLRIGKLKNFFGAGSSTTTSTESTSTTDAAAAEETKPAEPVERAESIALEVSVKPVTVVPMTREEKAKARSRYVACPTSSLLYSILIMTASSA